MQTTFAAATAAKQPAVALILRITLANVGKDHFDLFR
jgi:hypothetical protein